MRLSDEQAKHIAETLRIVAIAEFGFLGYTAGLKRHDWWLMAASSLSFILIESVAVLILGDRTSWAQSPQRSYGLV